MLTQELLAYIKSALQQEDKESVKHKLRSIGWSEEDIVRAFFSISVHTTDSLQDKAGQPHVQMDRSDFWTHICTVIIAFLTTVLPGSFVYGFTTHTVIYICGAILVIVIAVLWRYVVSRN